MARYARGGIGRALGLKNAKLGMRIEGEKGDEGPPPGTPEFGYRAYMRRRKLLQDKRSQMTKQPTSRPKRHIFIQRDDSLREKVLKA